MGYFRIVFSSSLWQIARTQTRVFIARKEKFPVGRSFSSSNKSDKRQTTLHSSNIVNAADLCPRPYRVTQDSLPLIETLEKEKSSCTTLWLVPYLSSLRCPPCARCVSRTNFFNGLRSAHSGRNVRVLLPAKGIKILSCSRLLSVNGTFRS